METVTLVPMTRPLCHRIFSLWQNDPALYEKPEDCLIYHYEPARVDAYFDRLQVKDRVVFAILAGDNPVGELQLKGMDPVLSRCTLSIHLVNDSVKNRGYGTRAVRLAIAHAFSNLGLQAVYADARIANARSRHVLQKAGFTLLYEQDGFAYYRITQGE